MGLILDEDFEGQTRFGVRVTRSLHHEQSEFQSIDIVDTQAFGRVLALDGVFQTSEGDEHYYHEMLVHPAMLSVPDPRRVLVVGGGDGGSVREVLRHPCVEHVTMCELDEAVVRACQQHLTSFGVPWDDPRLTLRFQDGVTFLDQCQPGAFDVILVDGPDPVGPAAGLFESPFYTACKSRLAPQGVLAVQSESPYMMREAFLRIVKTLRSVFTHATPYYAPVPIYMSGYWSFTFATEQRDPLNIDAERAAAIMEGCRYLNADMYRSAFAQPTDVLRALAEDADTK
ncbi:MAG: polyamine aminopropyltransferase [Myxococcales bacterium]|nr:polyamine aminopropyltransferase [Myxococcales bacterium]